ncbi:hypothetical protein MMC14_008753 [Varicellaria rhodocarpa]|nr:hypothetical protein [Varicellaria rhodocarpa]
MPKKYKNNQYTKPASSVHPSLRSSSNITGNDSNSSAATSVNDLIQHFRRSQVASVADRQTHNDTNTPTVHPSLKAILQLPDTLPPRPRSGMFTSDGRRHQRPAGPLPPGSWMTDSIHAPRRLQDIPRRRQTEQYHRPRNLHRLPGLYLPDKKSLVHQTLKALATNWQFHIQYDQYYLAMLPGRLKQALLAYIAVRDSDSGVTLKGLETLFLDQTQLKDATGSDDITHLDLAASISNSELTFKELHTFLTKQPPSESLFQRLPSRTSSPDDVPEFWDDPDPTSSAAFLTAVPRFPLLTHLSLSHARQPSWRSLLSLAPHLATLTHLSLGYWPSPSLTPNSNTASTTSPIGNVPYGATNLYSASDGDWSEGASILRRLAKATLCLKWLDLEGCTQWAGVLGYSEDGGRFTRPAAGYNDFWRSLDTIRTAQGSSVPECFQTPNRWDEVIRGEVAVQAAALLDAEDGPAISAAETREMDELKAWLKAERKIVIVERAVSGFRRGAGGKRITFDKGWNLDSSLAVEIEAAVLKCRDQDEYLKLLGYVIS